MPNSAFTYERFSCYESEDFVFSHSRYKKSSSFQHKTTVEYEFMYYNAVSGAYSIEDKKFNLSPGMVLITPPAVVHHHDYHSDSPIDRFHIRINPALFSSDIVKRLPKDLYALNVGEDSSIARLFKKLDYYFKSFENENLRRAILINTIEEIVFNIVLHHKNQKITPEHFPNPIFSKVIAFIAENIHNNISVNMICKELFVSKSYLNQIFMQRLATTPKKYINEKKIYLAQIDIQNGSLPTEIFSKYGFENYSTFYRNYKNILQCTPSEDYRSKKQ